jgi:hypothetical protein
LRAKTVSPQAHKRLAAALRQTAFKTETRMHQPWKVCGGIFFFRERRGGGSLRPNITRNIKRHGVAKKFPQKKHAAEIFPWACSSFGPASAYHFWYQEEHERIVKRFPAFFYELPSGHVPVREWIRSLDAADRMQR